MTTFDQAHKNIARRAAIATTNATKVDDYVVTYDLVKTGEEGHYGNFSSPGEAKRLFYDAFGPAEVRNVRLCRIVENWPSPADE